MWISAQMLPSSSSLPSSAELSFPQWGKALLSIRMDITLKTDEPARLPRALEILSIVSSHLPQCATPAWILYIACKRQASVHYSSSADMFWGGKLLGVPKPRAKQIRSTDNAMRETRGRIGDFSCLVGRPRSRFKTGLMGPVGPLRVLAVSQSQFSSSWFGFAWVTKMIVQPAWVTHFIHFGQSGSHEMRLKLDRMHPMISGKVVHYKQGKCSFGMELASL